MLGWALTFLVVALIAAVLGFTSIAGAAMGVAKILFYVFLVLFLVSVVMHFIRGRGVSGPFSCAGRPTRCGRAHSASPSRRGRRCESSPHLFPPH